jgi:hypothetical protein
MKFVTIVIGACVVYAIFFRRELLIEERSFKIFLVLSIILFLLGLVTIALYFMGFQKILSPPGALLCPLITLAQFRLSRRVFLKYVGREPKDTSFVWSTKGLGPDILFNLLYFIPAFWILIFVSGGVDQLLNTLSK